MELKLEADQTVTLNWAPYRDGSGPGYVIPDLTADKARELCQAGARHREQQARIDSQRERITELEKRLEEIRCGNCYYVVEEVKAKIVELSIQVNNTEVVNQTLSAQLEKANAAHSTVMGLLGAGLAREKVLEQDNATLGREADSLAGTIKRQTDKINELEHDLANSKMALGLSKEMYEEEKAKVARALAYDAAAKELQDVLAGALDRYVGGRLAPEWRPIETAPRDGSFFLARNGNIHCPIAVASWHDNGWDLHSPFTYYSPTHWQPLPNGPKP